MRHNTLTLACLALLAALLPVTTRAAEAAESYQRISGAGSTWAKNAIDSMRSNVQQFGIPVDYSGIGSTAGRAQWLNGTQDFAASDIPFQFEPEDGSEPERPKAGSFAYIPVTAGGTAFMYNLKINGQRVTNLRLSGENVAKIFTGKITQWNDPAIAADNPGLQLPARQIVPVVRSDGSGSTHQFTNWMIAQHGSIWRDYCERSGRAPRCGSTSQYPTIAGMISKPGDDGVAAHVAQSFAEGAIGYVNYSYALNVNFPVAKVLNAAGYYTEPTPQNVAVSLLQARINNDSSDLARYLTQDLSGVYTDTDPRNYPLSSYSYLILPTEVRPSFGEAKGRTLGAFAQYAMCQAQQQSASLGYSPIPINLVEAAFEQIRLVPGAEVDTINIQECHNPTFSPDGRNLLAENAPQPAACDRRGSTQCGTGTGGTATGGNSDRPAAGGNGTVVGAGNNGTAGLPGSNGTVTDGGTGQSGDTGDNGTGGVDSGGAGTDGAPGAEEVCDPETGVCVASTDGPTGESSADGGAESGNGNEVALAQARSTVLPAESGWSSTQTLAVLVILLVLGLVVSPAILWRRLAGQDGPR